MLSKKFVDVLGWLNQADELIQRCQDDLSRSRTYRTPFAKKTGRVALESLTSKLESIRQSLDHAADAFIHLENASNPAFRNGPYGTDSKGRQDAG
jgi:hypothetical protein